MNNYAYFKFNMKPLPKLTISPGLSFINRKNINVFEINTMLYWGDPSTTYRFQKPLWVGISYRPSPQDLAAFFGINITKNLSVGYSYEANLKDVGKNSNGTHELVLQLKIRMYEKIKHCPAYSFEKYWDRR